MPHNNQAIRADIKNSVRCWLATVDRTATPKEMFRHHGDNRIVVADITSNNTVRNIRAHPSVCVSFIDVFRPRGLKVLGSAKLIALDESDILSVGADLLRTAGTDFPVRNLISTQIEWISRLWAPSYTLFRYRTEVQTTLNAYDACGVVPDPMVEQDFRLLEVAGCLPE